VLYDKISAIVIGYFELLPMKRHRSKKLPHILWAFFTSVRLTIVVLIILAITSILGTIIPQQQGAAEFASRLSPGMLRLFAALDLFDMYHSVWFRTLLGLLSLNLIICSLDRWPTAWKRFTARPGPEREKPFEGLPSGQSVHTSADPKNAADRIGQLLQSRFRKIREKQADGNHFFYAEKGGFTYFGVYGVHLSVLLILVGGLVGSFFGFQGYVNILEGEQTDTVFLRKGMKPFKLDFEVRCDRFAVDFYENGAPKEYRSDLSFLENGREIRKVALLVNHPAQFKGITFYQASYGTAPGKIVDLRIAGPDTQEILMKVESGKPVQLPGGEGAFSVVDVRPDIMNLGPAVMISVKPANQDETVDFWVFKNQEALRRIPGPMRQSPKFNPAAFEPYAFFLDGIETRYYTGLQVNKDLGVPIVWVGCFLMVAGLFFTFFTSHRRIWIRVLRTATGSRIEAAGMASKNPVGLERDLDRLMEEIRKKILSI